MSPCRVIILIIVLLLLLASLGYCSYSCSSNEAAEKYHTYTAPLAPPTPPVGKEGSVEIDLSAAKVTKQSNPANCTTMKKFDYSPTNVNGTQVYLVGTEFNGSFYLLVRTQLNVTQLTAGMDFSPVDRPQYLEINITGPPGTDYLFALPLSAQSGQVTLHYKP